MFRLVSVTDLSSLVNLLEEGLGEESPEEEGFLNTAHPGNLDEDEARRWIATLRREIQYGADIPVSVVPDGQQKI